MKVRVPLHRYIPALAFLIILGAGAIFGFTFDLFLFSIPYDWRQYVIIGIWATLSIALILGTRFTSYYVIYKKYVEVQKGFKKLIYYYGDVVYIDEEKSERKKTIHFYTRQGHCRYLMFDKHGELYKTMLANCKNRISKEEFASRYPQVNL